MNTEQKRDLLRLVLSVFSSETDNYGQIVIYTGFKHLEDDFGDLTEMTEEDYEAIDRNEDPDHFLNQDLRG